LDDDGDMVPVPVRPDVFEVLDPGLARHVYIEEDDIGQDLGCGEVNEQFKAVLDPIQFIIDSDVSKGKFEKRGLGPVVVADDYFNRSLHGTLIGI
jgi:hypothetical protein